MNVYNSLIYNGPSWKQLKCPSASEWINYDSIQWNTTHFHTVFHTVEYYSQYTMQQTTDINNTMDESQMYSAQ